MSYKQLFRKPVYALIAVVLAVMLLPVTAFAADTWTQKQIRAHEIANMARSLNLPEDNPIIVEAKRLWHEDYGVSSDTQNEPPAYTDDDATMLAKIIYSEGRGIPSDTEKACLVWVVLNRVDAGYGNTIAEVAAAPAQFGYRASAPVWDNLLLISHDVLSRWQKEKNGETEVGRVLPKDYLWYSGDGVHNYFRNSYKGGTRWDYSLPTPYES
ncbi:MAG: cell wall hydrolase [Clostridiales bacterium]|jgi:hypothetical protein|nr:cell wall hydrolase [Clostridiales bacterium]